MHGKSSQIIDLKSKQNFFFLFRLFYKEKITIFFGGRERMLFRIIFTRIFCMVIVLDSEHPKCNLFVAALASKSL